MACGGRSPSSVALNRSREPEPESVVLLLAVVDVVGDPA